MSDLFSYADQTPEKPQKQGDNVMSVTQLSNQLRMLVEGKFSRTVVEGEISGLKIATSGHVYFDLKDDTNLIKGIIWKGSAGKLTFKPEDGMQVVVHGKVTTYGARSNYQIVVSRMEPAGIGLLMQRFEELKKQLTVEGLFAPERKKNIPFLPTRIGIVTSPTGAVIDDMKHRISERFPRHVLFAPVLVQGPGAKEQIAAAIGALNNLPDNKRPDVIIVARGGGSLEDLWAFNEEIVVRAVANSSIPIISGVGHEPDVTLCDYAADKRAPTPTGAAEMVVPVRQDLIYTVSLHQGKLHQAMLNELKGLKKHIKLLATALPDPQSQLNQARLRLDDRSERLRQGLLSVHRLMQQRFKASQMRLTPQLLQRQISRQQERLGQLQRPLSPEVFAERIERLQHQLQEREKLLESLSPHGPLKRGYVYITDNNGEIIRSANSEEKSAVTLHFADGERQANMFSDK